MMTSKEITKLALFLFSAIFLFWACEKIYEPIEIQGKVVDVETDEPVPLTQVRIINPEEIAAQTFTDENGDYYFSEVDVDSIIDITIEATRPADIQPR